MPYRVSRIDPRDLEERRAIGIKIPFSSPSVFSETYQTIDMYRANVLNFLSTAKRERYFNPSFGNELLNALFEHYSVEKQKAIEKSIKYDLEYYFPRLNIDELRLTPSDNLDSYSLVLRFSIKGTNQRDELTINIK